MGKLWISFRADLPERNKRFPSWAGAEKFAVDLNFGENNGILVETGPSLRSKRFRAVKDQRTRNGSQRPREKWRK